MANFFEDDWTQLQIEDDIIFGVIYSENITLSLAKRIVENRYKIANGKSYSTYIDITRIKFVSKEARDFLSSEKATKNLNATALFTNNLISTITASFFLNFNKPNLPAKIFDDQAEALMWLKEKNWK